MKSIYFLSLIILISACSLSKKAKSSENLNTDKPQKELRSVETFSLETIVQEQLFEETKQILTSLSSDNFEGRRPGTKGFEICVEYVESFLSKHDIAPFYGDSYKDSLKVNDNNTYNVVGLIGERNDEKPYILIGAHLDHLGKSKSKRDSIYNGANDNASGVTAVLQVAAQIAKYQFDQPIIVVLFTAEENNLIGSRHLADRLQSENIKLSYVINFEMIGKTLTTGADQVYITGFNKSNFAKEMNEVAGRPFVKFLPAEIRYQLFSRSDNFPFYAAYKIPSHTISTFDFENFEHYHKVSDEIEGLDIENMHQVINSTTFIIGELVKNKVDIKMNKD